MKQGDPPTHTGKMPKGRCAKCLQVCAVRMDGKPFAHRDLKTYRHCDGIKLDALQPEET